MSTNYGSQVEEDEVHDGSHMDTSYMLFITKEVDLTLSGSIVITNASHMDSMSRVYNDSTQVVHTQDKSLQILTRIQHRCVRVALPLTKCHH